MTSRSTQHGSFTIERIDPAAPARVFAAFADPAAKALWFGGPHEEWKELVREHDFRVGGRERVSGQFAGGRTSHFYARYHDIVPDERIVYAYDMRLDDAHISVSIATITIEPSGADARLVFTEQAVFLDGYDDSDSRERGTQGLLDQLGASLG
jgi:uncharacterized protein YndB with AHSA1/START domain